MSPKEPTPEREDDDNQMDHEDQNEEDDVAEGEEDDVLGDLDLSGELDAALVSLCHY
jgi:hypothetical protein